MRHAAGDLHRRLSGHHALGRRGRGAGARARWLARDSEARATGGHRCRDGARRAGLRVAIAPSIGPCCYEVGEPVISDFTQAFGEARWDRWARPTSNGHVMLDLWTANEELLSEAGVDPRRIENPRLCTACHP